MADEGYALGQGAELPAEGDDDQTRPLNSTERKGLLWANLTSALLVVLVAVASLQPGGVFRAGSVPGAAGRRGEVDGSSI